MTTEEIKVEESFDSDGRPFLKVHSSKFASPFTIYKLPGGFVMYGIMNEKGKLAKEISGSYTTIAQALNSLKMYIRSSKKSATVKRNEHGDNYERRKKAKNA